MKTPEERKAAAAARQAKLQAKIDAAKAKRRGAINDAKQATRDTVEQARQAHADALADGQAGVDAAKARQAETIKEMHRLGGQVGEEWQQVKDTFRETYAEERAKRRGGRD